MEISHLSAVPHLNCTIWKVGRGTYTLPFFSNGRLFIYSLTCLSSSIKGSLTSPFDSWWHPLIDWLEEWIRDLVSKRFRSKALDSTFSLWFEFITLRVWAHRRLEVAWKLPIGCGWALESLYCPCEVEILKLILCGSLEKSWELKKLQTFVAPLMTRT